MRSGSAALAMSAGLAVWTPAVMAAPQAPVAVGQVITSASDEPVAGWRRFSGAMFAARATASGVTTETLACCVVVLMKGGDYVVARTEAVERNARGGVVSERVLGAYSLTRSAAETPVECGLFWISPAFSLKDKTTQMVRSVVVTDKGFETLTWKDPDRRCDYDG